MHGPCPGSRQEPAAVRKRSRAKARTAANSARQAQAARDRVPPRASSNPPAKASKCAAASETAQGPAPVVQQPLTHGDRIDGKLTPKPTDAQAGPARPDRLPVPAIKAHVLEGCNRNCARPTQLAAHGQLSRASSPIADPAAKFANLVRSASSTRPLDRCQFNRTGLGSQYSIRNDRSDAV